MLDFEGGRLLTLESDVAMLPLRVPPHPLAKEPALILVEAVPRSSIFLGNYYNCNSLLLKAAIPQELEAHCGRAEPSLAGLGKCEIRGFWPW